MPIECTAEELAELAVCLNGLSPVQQAAAQTYLLCQIASNGGGAEQTPWLSNINGGGFSLSNVAAINGVTAPLVAVKSADQSINTVSVVDATDLVLTGMPAGLYQVNLYLRYSGNNNSAPYTSNFVWTSISGGFPTIQYIHQNTSDVATTTTLIGTATTQFSATALGIDSSNAIRTALVSFLINLTATSSIQHRFSNGNGPGPSVTCRAGSTLIAQKIA